MTTDRPYRGAMPSEDAVAELVANTGAQFDPRVVTALMAVVAHGEPAAVTTIDGVRAVLASAPVPQSAGAAG
jgi:HD-GYP domain-containing protein (c-di-GMP phosphodiesterase class II)